MTEVVEEHIFGRWLWHEIDWY